MDSSDVHFLTEVFNLDTKSRLEDHVGSDEEESE